MKQVEIVEVIGLGQLALNLLLGGNQFQADVGCHGVGWVLGRGLVPIGTDRVNIRAATAAWGSIGLFIRRLPVLDFLKPLHILKCMVVVAHKLILNRRKFNLFNPLSKFHSCDRALNIHFPGAYSEDDSRD